MNQQSSIEEQSGEHSGRYINTAPQASTRRGLDGRATAIAEHAGSVERTAAGAAKVADQFLAVVFLVRAAVFAADNVDLAQLRGGGEVLHGGQAAAGNADIAAAAVEDDVLGADQRRALHAGGAVAGIAGMGFAVGEGAHAAVVGAAVDLAQGVARRYRRFRK